MAHPSQFGDTCTLTERHLYFEGKRSYRRFGTLYRATKFWPSCRQIIGGITSLGGINSPTGSFFRPCAGERGR